MGLTGFFKSLIEGGKVDVARRYEILREAVSRHHVAASTWPAIGRPSRSSA